MASDTTNGFVEQQVQEARSRNFSSPEAEMAVIGGILRKPAQNKGTLAQLHDDDFTDDNNRRLFQAIKATAAKGQAIDLITVDATFTAMFPNEAKKLAPLMIEASRTGVASYIDSYIRIITELSTRRRGLAMLDDIASRLKNPEIDIHDTMERMRQQTTQIVNSTHSWMSMADLLIKTFERLEQRAKGEEKCVTTGIRNIDALIGGFFPGEMTVIGARPGVGKSAFGANIALAAARNGMKVGIVSREMTDVQFGQRLLANGSNVDGMKLRKATIEDEDWESLADAMSYLAPFPVSFLFSVSTIEDLRVEVQKKAEKKELDLLIVDYLQLMSTTQRFPAEHLRVGYMSRALKEIAMDFQIPVVALAQVNRSADDRMPTLKDLKESGRIEEDADGVVFLHRPTSAEDPYVDKRDREAFANFKKRGATYICIGVAKQRQGTVGQACVLFDSKHMRYIQIAREEPPGQGGPTDEQKPQPTKPAPARPEMEYEQLSIGR